ncbi:unnamed protein product [Mytilus coruscus]|uniref:Uncharacterized protein n=1 Tax=Mytilus coruscus TaxID=42192 RepID=A0A6J8C7A1_MYTCO|nr:unnamed protein product [Mytilus coruscus]
MNRLMLLVNTVLLVITWTANGAHGCSSFPQHPQSQFCSSDFGHRSRRKKMIRSCDFVKRTSSLSFEETFFIFTSGPYSYLKNCKDGCNDIGDSSKGCHFSHENYATIDCLSGSAVCRKEKNVCKWFNGEKCPSITTHPSLGTTPSFRPRPVMRR